MKPLVKICGLSTHESVATARDGGATHLGFIFFQKSPRNVSPQMAADLTTSISTCKTVAVTVNADDEFLDGIVATMQPAMLQLHGGESRERVTEVKSRFNLPVIKAFAIRDAEDLALALSYDDVADILLLDAKPPKGSDLPGGNGVRFDWSLLSHLQSQSPALLSGGIDLNNVDEAMHHVRSAANSIQGLDVSSGVESAPGIKDIEKIKSFLTACQ